MLFWLCLLAFSLNVWNNRFPIGYHFDEPKKVAFIQTGTQDFMHPILMLELVRWVNSVLQWNKPDEIALLGRMVIAAGGSITVFLTYCFFRQALGPTWALWTAFCLATCPTQVVHAHYFKEDLVYLPCAVLSLIVFVRFAKQPSLRLAIALGAANGLAFSSQYKAALLLPFYAIGPILVRVVRLRKRLGKYYGGLLLSAVVAAYVRAIINFPGLQHREMLFRGVRSELHHITTGHEVRILPQYFYFGYHLIHSILPSVTTPMALLCLVGLASWCWNWRALSLERRVAACFIVLNYLASEISPSKPPPDAARYMLPIVPFLIGSAADLLSRLRRVDSWVRYLGCCLAVCVPLWCFVDTLLLVQFLEDDTRAEAKRWLVRHDSVAVFDAHGGTRKDFTSILSVDLERLRSGGVTHIVTSSFSYDYYDLGRQLPRQPADVLAKHQCYGALFARYPYVEFAPRYREFAFSNPIVRVLDINNPKQLDPASSRTFKGTIVKYYAKSAAVDNPRQGQRFRTQEFANTHADTLPFR